MTDTEPGEGHGSSSSARARRGPTRIRTEVAPVIRARAGLNAWTSSFSRRTWSKSSAIHSTYRAWFGHSAVRPGIPLRFRP
jgi:hypothetical protein